MKAKIFICFIMVILSNSSFALKPGDYSVKATSTNGFLEYHFCIWDARGVDLDKHKELWCSTKAPYKGSEDVNRMAVGMDLKFRFYRKYNLIPPLPKTDEKYIGDYQRRLENDFDERVLKKLISKEDLLYELRESELSLQNCEDREQQGNMRPPGTGREGRSRQAR